MSDNSISYPKRESFFAVHFLRLLFSVESDLLENARILLTKIALVEDQKRYSSAPNFFNSQFRDLFGWSEDKLNRVRLECVQSEWLDYTKGGKSKAGVYFVIVPEKFQEIAENDFNLYPHQCGGKCGYKCGPSIPKPNTFKKVNKKEKSSKPIPEKEKLFELVQSWNEIDGISKCANSEGKALLASWKKAQRDPELRTHLEDIPGLIAAIRGSPFLLNQKWFKLHWIFRNKDDQWNITKILNGDYRSDDRSQRKLSRAEQREASNARALDEWERQSDHVQGGIANTLFQETDIATHTAHAGYLGN